MLPLLLLACVPDDKPASDRAPADTGPDDTDPVDSGDTDTADTDTADTDTTDTGSDTDTGDTAAPAARWGGWPTADRAAMAITSEVVVADLDGDGLSDLLTCREELRWILNPGGPFVVNAEWAAPWSRTAEYDDSCGDLDVADLDGDGDLDALLTFDDAGAVAWAENLGGTFADPVVLQDHLEELATLGVGDFDGDGHVDIAAAPFVLWNGGGAFTTERGPCAGWAYRLDALPLLADGRSTLFCGDGVAYVADAARVWAEVRVADGCRAFPTDGGPTRAADLDGDGARDAFFGGGDVCLGDGTGALAFGAHLGAADEAGWVTSLADADGDGALDLVVNREDGAAPLTLYRNVGGAFVEAQALTLPYWLHQDGGALWEDLDGDGVTDLFAWDLHDDAGYWFPALPDGTFPTPWLGDPVSSNLDFRGVPADLDGDGVSEIVGVAPTEAAAWSADGARSYTEGAIVPLALSSRTPGALALDADGDGDEEVLVTYPSALLLDGLALDVTTLALSPLTADNRTWWPADLDGDGDDELLIENLANARGDVDGDGDEEDPERVLILGLGGAALDDSALELPDALGALAARVDDLDGDGRAELVVVDAAGVRVWGWDGASLAERASIDLAWATGATDLTARRGLGFADADGDGVGDLWLALRDEAAVLVLVHDGALGFTLGDRIAAPAEMVDADLLAFGALGGDAVTAWVADASGDRLAVTSWRREAVGFVGLPTSSPGIDGYAAPALRDMDGDGAVDLVGGARDRLFVQYGWVESP